MADAWDQFPDAKTTGPRIADMWSQFPDHNPAAGNPNAEPDAATWWGRRVQDYKGKQDPRYKGLGTVYEQFPDQLRQTTQSAAILGASDPQMGDVIQKQLGNNFVRREKDANDYEMFVTRGKDGQEQRGYLNKPGLDLQDVARAGYGSMPYVVAGGAAALTGGAGGVGVNALLQGAAGLGTSVTGDKVLESMGSKQGIEGGKALAATGFGVAGPVFGKLTGAMWQRFVTEPRFFNRASGVLTAEGKAAAQSMGLDPATMMADAQRTFGKTYAADPQAAADLVQSGRLDFNVPQTLGQRTKDSEQLMIEKAARSNTYGETARDRVIGLDQDQRTAVETAARTTIPRRLIADPSGAPLPPAWQQESGAVNLDPTAHGTWMQDALQTARGAAKKTEGDLWDQTSAIYPSSKANPIIRDKIRDSLGDFAHVFDEVNTPIAHRMGQRVIDFLSGDAPQRGLSSEFGLQPNASVDTMRRSLGLMVKDAVTPTDKAAASAVYRGYNDGIKEAAKQSALSGSVEDLQKFNNAIDWSREMNGMFAPSVRGRLTPGGRIIEKVLNGDTPESIVNALFHGPKAGIGNGALEAIAHMKRAVMTYGDTTVATDFWSSLKAAQWSKIVQGKDGQMLGYQQQLTNARTAMVNQRSLMEALYEPSDLALMGRYIKTLEGITYKDPNPSGTATGVAVLSKQLFGKLFNAFGPVGRTVLEYSGIPKAYKAANGAAVARKAVSQIPVRGGVNGPNLGPLGGAAGSAYERQQ